MITNWTTEDPSNENCCPESKYKNCLNVFLSAVVSKLFLPSRMPEKPFKFLQQETLLDLTDQTA